MPEINLCNAAGRDAVVNMENVVVPLQVRWLDPDGRQAQNVRFLKSTLSHDVEALEALAAESGKEVSQLLVESDVDVDLEVAGSYLMNTSRVYINPENEIVHKAIQYEVIKNPDGSIREERLAQRSDQNVSGEIPLGWSGIFMKKTEAIKKFVFASKLQLTHINGLTYDFLFGIAKELEEKDSVMLVGGGPKNNQPLVLRRGSLPYRGFLEGRTRGDSYLLMLHLSNLELKFPDDDDERDDD